VAEERRALLLSTDARSKGGGPEKYHERLDASGKLFVRDGVRNLLPLASDLVVDAGVQPENLRPERAVLADYLADRRRQFPDRPHGVPPV